MDLIDTDAVTVQPMRWWDIPEVHAIEVACFPVDSWTIEQFWSELAEVTRCYLVAVHHGEVIGYAGIFHAGADADIQTIAVRPGDQRRGVGGLLLAGVIAVAVDRGAAALLLEVRDDNAPAIAMYSAAGFEQIATRRRYYPDGADARILRRAL